MKTRIEPDGSLILEERLTLLRWGAALGALLLVAALAWNATTRGAITPREILGGAAGFAGLFVLAALVPDREFRFERPLARLRWTTRRLFATCTGEVAFADIERVTLRSEIDTDFRQRPLRYTPLLVTRTGALTLTSFASADEAECRALATTIHAALGRPGKGPEPTTVEDLVAAGFLVDAVALARRLHGLDLTAAKAMVDAIRVRRYSQPSRTARA